MQIIIPMSGVGERFKKAGYADPKPLIQINGKTIIEHVIDLFPGEDDFIFICNQEHLKNTKMKHLGKSNSGVREWGFEEHYQKIKAFENIPQVFKFSVFESNT